MTRTKLIVSLALAASAGLALANPATAGVILASGSVSSDPVYQIDDGVISAFFNNTLGTETTSNQAEDNWVGNVFTAVGGGTILQSISFQSGFADVGGLAEGLNSTTMPSAFITAALYIGSPASGLTLVTGSVHTEALNTTAGEFVTVSFATPQVVTPGEVFTAALFINDVPNNVFPFAIDSSGVSTGSYYDIGSPVGSVYSYSLAFPNHPTLNGATYPGQPDGATNAFAGATILRVNAVPEPGSLTLLGAGAIGLTGYRWRRRRT